MPTVVKFILELSSIQDKYIGWSTSDFNISSFGPSPDWTALGWIQSFESSSYQMSIGAGLMPWLYCSSGATIRSLKYVKPTVPLIVGHECVVRFRFEFITSALNPNFEVGITGLPGVYGTTPNRSLTHKAAFSFYSYNSNFTTYKSNTGNYDGSLDSISSGNLSGLTLGKNQTIEIILSLMKNSSSTIIKVVFFINGEQKYTTGYYQDLTYDSFNTFWDGVFPFIYLAGASARYLYPVTMILTKSS